MNDIYGLRGHRPCNVNVGNANANNGLFNLNGNNDWSNAGGVRITRKC